ncbi:hypothetical protein [Pseudofrankia inefficax]|uniref:hypothetical protein n=1 Tax=Pseudofrankia inefficax (strain DSM 45817 / CECT 9037 / DDB 130130 / EuI1c) TaxID=298654 RepID=UPI0012FD9091|nr:hypothetical protein [Pseudofrankia inefficax]
MTLLVALLWGASRGRPRRAREAATIEGYRRMVTALERPVGTPGDAPDAARPADAPRDAGEDPDNRHLRVPDVLRGLRRSPKQPRQQTGQASARPAPARAAESLDVDLLADGDPVYPTDRDTPLTAVPAAASVPPSTPVTQPDAVIPATRAVVDAPVADEPERPATAAREVSAAAEAPADSG